MNNTRLDTYFPDSFSFFSHIKFHFDKMQREIIQRL